MIQEGVSSADFNHLLALDKNLGMAQMRFNKEPTVERLNKYQCTEDGKDLEIKRGHPV